MSHIVTVIADNVGKTTLTAQDGENLLALLRRNGVGIDAPCGGNHTCGKCLVRVLDGGSPAASAPSAVGDPCAESPVSGGAADTGSIRLACAEKITSDMVVSIVGAPALPPAAPQPQAKIATDGIRRAFAVDPFVRREFVRMPPPTLDDQRDDAARLLGACGASEIDIAALRELPSAMRAGGYAVAVTRAGGLVTAVEGARAVNDAAASAPVHAAHALTAPALTAPAYIHAAPALGVAFDLGTTTIAAYLCRLDSGTTLAARSAMNPQRAYGADVVSRIGYAISDERASAVLQSAAVSAMDGLIGELSEAADVSRRDIVAAYVAGNTTMLHFFLGIPARAIAAAPFVAATTALHTLPAASLGLGIASGGVAVALPCASAYIGADTVAAAMACGFGDDEGPNLLIDIGTNGEIVVGGRGRILACSAAAGPAFEGACIRDGVGGVAGAIDSVRVEGGELRVTTIGRAPAIGICGSGLVDAAAALLRCGAIGETGRLESRSGNEPCDASCDASCDAPCDAPSNAPCGVPCGTPSNAPCDAPAVAPCGAPSASLRLPPALRARLTEVDGQRAFVIAAAGELGAASDIVLTQKDIRELQNAKAAIAAGIKVAAARFGVSLGGIRRVYIAGGFGNCIDLSSAMAIGLLPRVFAGKTVQAGNAAGSGAVMAMLSSRSLAALSEIRQTIECVELSASAEFADEYIGSMLFMDN